MVIIRLARHGRKNDPFYRIVAIDKAKKVVAAPLANLGFWNPREKKKEINKKGVEEWVKKGAKISPAVKKLFEL